MKNHKTAQDSEFKLYSTANSIINLGKKMKKSANTEKDKSTALFISKIGDILARVAEPTIVPEYDKEYIQLAMAELSVNLDQMYNDEK